MQKFRWFAGLIFGCTVTMLILSNYKLLTRHEKKKNMKYILQWSSPNADPFFRMGVGQDEFLKRSCPVNNCYVTSNKNYLYRIQDYDAVLFHGPEFSQHRVRFPKERANYQKYVFVSRESPAYYKLSSPRFDRFFNWTYTYKLNSDIYFGYIIIRNKDGNVIGPKRHMHWMKAEDMKAIDSKFKKKLESKRLTAAWFVSNCYTPSERETIALELRDELAKRGLVLDIYTKYCDWNDTKSCPKSSDWAPMEPDSDCFRILETDYYFYLAFENSLSEDYVTEKLLHAVQHYTVPIVYGGANYSRFLPEGSYLDARKLDIRALVTKIVVSTLFKEKYYDFFKWTNHYSYEAIDKTPETDYMCSLCRAINNGVSVHRKKKTVYKDIRTWWNLPRIFSYDY